MLYINNKNTQRKYIYFLIDEYMFVYVNCPISIKKALKIVIESNRYIIILYYMLDMYHAIDKVFD